MEQSLDEKRQHQTAYEYLCHLEEAKIWLEHHLHIELPSSADLEEYLRNGVVLARLANFFAPEFLSERKIYDINFAVFSKKGLVFKHTDNCVNFFLSMEHIKLPKVFYPETTDIYEMKNMPKLIYCIHALSFFLAKLGKAKPIQNLMGKVNFTDDEIMKIAESLKKYGVQMPAFSKIGGILASELSEDDAALHAAILLINEAIEAKDTSLMMERLHVPAAKLYGVKDSYSGIYMTKLSALRDKKCSRRPSTKKDENEEVYDRNLRQDEIQSCLKSVNLEKCLAILTQAARDKNEPTITSCLTDTDLSAQNVLFNNKDLYVKHFHKFVAAKDASYVFNVSDVNTVVDKCNVEAEKRNRIYAFVTALNKAMANLTPDALRALFAQHKAELGEEFLCYDSGVQWLKHALQEKVKSTNDPSAELWFDEIKAVVVDCNAAVKEARAMVVTVEKLNKYFQGKDVKQVQTAEALSMLAELNVSGVAVDCKNDYIQAIGAKVASQNFKDWNQWCDHKLASNKQLPFQYNHSTFKYNWYDHVTINSAHGYLGRPQLQALVNEVTADHDRDVYFQANSSNIALVQAFLRTIHAQKLFSYRPGVLMLQSYVRTCSIHKHYKGLCDFNAKHAEKIALLYRAVACASARHRMNQTFSVYQNNIKDVIVLQSLIRSIYANMYYDNLVNSENPTYSAVCKFVRLLDVDANDLREETELARLKDAVLKTIQVVNVKEVDNREIDVRIGLLVKNKLQVDEVLSGSKKSNRRTDFSLNIITKEKEAVIANLGTLLYILQTKPEYIAKIVLRYLGDRSSVFIKETCFAIFNYGANIRDEFTIIRMFACALQLEVEQKIDSIQEFIKGDPLIVKMVVNFYRNAKAQTWLEEVVSNSVKDIVGSPYSINTNALEIYKRWINQLETETGKASGYPYDVDTDTALSYEEVQRRLEINITNMKEVCTKFMTAITKSFNKIPYGIRYVAKVLYMSLRSKFPGNEEVEYLKVISNLLYYRTINPAIVSPDTFNMMSSAEISAEKRKNLAAISAVLQRIASHNFSTGSSSESHMAVLNNFMAESWGPFQTWLMKCIDVETLTVHFNIDEYTDSVAIVHPELHLTIGQVYEVHKNVNELIESEPLTDNDPVFQLMKSIGELPEPREFIEKKTTGSNEAPEQLNEAAREVNINLTLIPPKVKETEDVARQKLLIETIKLVVDLMTFDNSDNLGIILKREYNEAQEASFAQILSKRNEAQAQLKTGALANPAFAEKDMNKIDGQQTIEPQDGYTPFTIKETQQAIIQNAIQLQRYGLVKIDDEYSDFVKCVARDIRNRRNYRKNRKFDLLRMRSALDNLNTKNAYLDEQKDYYKQYVNACIANLNRRKTTKSKKKNVVKYNASELYKQGVVLEVEGLSTNQFKNVQFELTATDDPGVFIVSAKLFGVSMDSMKLVFQDLLQLQYENITVLTMFDRARVNVNLLIHILNKKFYSKKR